MPPPEMLCPISDAELIALYHRHGSAKKVAEFLCNSLGFQVERNRVRRWLIALGVKLRPQRQANSFRPPETLPCHECKNPFSVTWKQYLVAESRAKKRGDNEIRMFCSRVCVYKFTSQENRGKTPAVDIERPIRRKKTNPTDLVYLVDEDGAKTLKNGPLEPGKED